MPNTFAYIALVIWPFISLIFYRQLSIVHATFLTIVGGYLLLPARTEIDLPLLPPFNKETISVISAFIGCVFIKKYKLKLIPKDNAVKLLLLVFVISPLFTVASNQEPVNFIRGLTLADGLAMMVNNYLILLPLIIGMQIIKTNEEQLLLFKLLVISAVFYSIFILYEIRMSPQLHTTLYGFFPHSFLQSSRYGGFRAVVFIGHGLTVSMFIAISLAASAILIKNKIRIFGFSTWLFAIFLAIVLVLNKSLAGVLFGLFLFIAITWFSNNMIRKISVMLIVFVMLYPVLTLYELFPHQILVQLATDYNVERGASLAYRFYHEGMLLEHVQEKIFFGWGIWGRNMLEHSVVDGLWIITLGVSGFVGFISLFGLLYISVWKVNKIYKLQNENKWKQLLFAHALIISVIMIDQVPNASLSAYMLLYTGALIGLVNNYKLQKKY